MYQVKYDKDNGLWWIVKDGKALIDLGGFIEPVTPRIIIQEIENEL